MYGMDEVPQPRSLAQLRDTALAGLRVAGATATAYRNMGGPTAIAMREALATRMPVEDADGLADTFRKQMAEVADAANLLRARLAVLANLAEAHHDRLRRQAGPQPGAFRV